MQASPKRQKRTPPTQVARLLIAAAVVTLALSVVAYEDFDGRATATGTDAATGDTNCDGALNSIDAALVLQRVARLVNRVGCEDAADVNCDGDLTSSDAAIILQHSAALIDLGGLAGCWQYDQEADYFIFVEDRTLGDGSVMFTYREICQPNGRVKGRGTAIVSGDQVSMEGYDDISTYTMEARLSSDGTRLSGTRDRREEIPEFPLYPIVLVKGKHSKWTETVCDLFL